MVTERDSIVFRIDPKLLQHRPPRLTLAATLETLRRRVETGELDANLVVDILDENRLLPYIIGDTKNLQNVSLGQLTNASKIGDIIVAEECIRGTYELCLAFLGFVLTTTRAPNYQDTSRTMLASITYIANEVYPNHHIWTYRNISDMNRILCRCTEIFYELVVKRPMSGGPMSDLEIVCIINLSQNQAHKQLVDTIAEGKQSIKKVITELEFDGEQTLREELTVICIRQSLSIFSKLLSGTDNLRNVVDSSKSIATSNKVTDPMTNIERALFDTSVRPGLLQQLFSYIYQKEDSVTACASVDLIKKVAEKFSMSLMACLGSEADKVCEFFTSYLEEKDSNVDLEIAILDLLSTCVKHQPGLIELFLNFELDTKDKKNETTTTPPKTTPSAETTATPSKNQPKSLQVIMNLLKECRSQQCDSYRSLHSHVMKFILTFWQKCHSAIDQFDKADQFWDSIAHPLVKFLDSDSTTTSVQETYSSSQVLNDELTSYSLMILAREIFNTNVGINGRKMNPQLKDKLDEELHKKNLIGKYSIYISKRYSKIESNLNQSDNYNRIISAWRDFLASCSKYKPIEISCQLQNQIVGNILACLSVELRLGERVNKERVASIGETLLLIWTKWMGAKNSAGDEIFKSIHELLYLTDSSKEYLPFSFLLTFQSTLNLYLMRNRDYLMQSKRSFDLLVPALQLMHFSLKVLEKFINNQTRDVEFEYKPCVESRLCQASIMTLRFIIDGAQRHVNLWLSYLQINLKTDSLVQFLTHLMNKRVGAEVCLSMIELLLCLSSIRQTAHYLNKSGLINQVNMIGLQAYEKPYAHLVQLANTTNPLMKLTNQQQQQQKQQQPAHGKPYQTSQLPATAQQRLQPGIDISSITSNLNDITMAASMRLDSKLDLTKTSLFDFDRSHLFSLQQPNQSQQQANTTIASTSTVAASSAPPPSTKVTTSAAAAAATPADNTAKSKTISDTEKTYLDNINSNSNWLPIYQHVIRLNISMILNLGNEFMVTAVEFLANNCIRICETIELLRTNANRANMDEALQLIYMINLVLRHGSLWLKRSRQSYLAISDEIGKTAQVVATSNLQSIVYGDSTTQQAQSTSTATAAASRRMTIPLKPRDYLIYARCCYDFGKYLEAERVLFQTKFGDKNDFIKEAPQIYGEQLSLYAFHLAALICLKTNRQSDSIDYALQVFAEDPEHFDILTALTQNRD